MRCEVSERVGATERRGSLREAVSGRSAVVKGRFAGRGAALVSAMASAVRLGALGSLWVCRAELRRVALELGCGVRGWGPVPCWRPRACTLGPGRHSRPARGHPSPQGSCELSGCADQVPQFPGESESRGQPSTRYMSAFRLCEGRRVDHHRYGMPPGMTTRHRSGSAFVRMGQLGL
jgi:hypothetical protein